MIIGSTDPFDHSVTSFHPMTYRSKNIISVLYNNVMIISPYIRTSYTLLESLVRIDDLIDRALALGYDYIAVVDRNMHGAMALRKALENTDIKVIFGLEINYRLADEIFDIVLYARNDRGYRFLYRASSIIWTQERPLSKDDLADFLNDIVIVVPSDKMTDRNLELFKKEFEHFYCGITDEHYPHQKRLNDNLRKHLKRYDIPSIAFYRTFYIAKEDEEAYRILTAIKDKKTIDDKDLITQSGAHLYDEKTINDLYDKDDLISLRHLFEEIWFIPTIRKTSLPSYRCPSGYKSRDYLVNLARFGLSKRCKGQVPEVYKKRLDHELNVILKMHFEDYFLIVYDFILFAKKNGIMVGPGRGSSAGSLVAYCLGITDIDPIAYDLIFERFLNIERITMPDIDVDFPDDKRQIVIDYVRDKYGFDHVAHIATYGTLKTKQVLRDVARVIGYQRIDSLCKLIPDDKMSLKEAFGIRAFQDRIKSDQKAEYLYRMSLKLEGLPRHYSTHAAGIVISNDDLKDVVPLVKIEEDMNSVGIGQGFLEELGLIKIDLLGLKNLSVIAEICDDIRKDDPSFSIMNIPLDDRKTYDLIDDVNVLGIFQLESSGMQNIIRKMRPKSFIDIATTIALFRPGPMRNIPLYLQNRQDPASIHYLHPSLKPILESTGGIIIYQEQIMQIAQVLAGFSYAKADIMRRAMSKKKEDELISLKNDFIEGAMARGVEKKTAEAIYDLILRFANYGFNKSHSIAYGLIAYEQAYLKANYPLYFYKALLNNVISSANKTYEYLLECKRISIKVAGPDISRSYDSYVIENDRLRMPFGVIKNVGSVSVKTIINERSIAPFKDYSETVARIKSIGKSAIESLIDAGAFDCFLLSRKTMRENLHEVSKIEVGMLLGPMLGIKLEEYPDDIKEVIAREKEVLGFAISFDQVEEIKKRNRINAEPLYRLKEKSGRVKGLGEVLRYRVIVDKRGKRMCFMTVGDDTGTVDLTIFAFEYVKMQDIIRNSKGKYVYFEGTFEHDSVLVDRLEVKE